MLIQGNSNQTRFNILVNKYVELIGKGTEASEILVLLLNSYKKANFINELKRCNPDINIDKNKIYTFWGLCYNAFQDNSEYIMKITGAKEGEKPNLCGLEVSQYIFRQSIKEADFSDYISKINLLHQLFRRYSLIVQNMLTPKEVSERSKLLNEVFSKDAQIAIDDYKLKTIEYKSFDYLRQLAVLPLIYKNTNYFNGIKYLLADDADEFPFAFWQFTASVMPNLKDYYIAYDKYGSTRCGYLCAYKSGINDFSKKYNPEIKILNEESKFSDLSADFYNSIIGNKKYPLNLLRKNFPKRLDMIDNIIKNINSLLKQGVKPNEISIITPVTDDILIKTIENRNIKFKIISGNEKLNDSLTVKHLLYILKLINDMHLLDFEIKSLLMEFLKIPYRKCEDIIQNYNKEKVLISKNFTEKNYDFAYKKLTSLIAAEHKHKNTLSEQIRIVYTNLLKDFELDTDNEKYDFLLKEAENFEKAFMASTNNITEEFITQTENSVISENPADSFALPEDCIIVSSPQKIIDFSINTKYQFWADISDNEWIKQDTGTLYNAWVLNRDWNKKEYTLEDNIILTRDKSARILRKLMLLAQEDIILYSSTYDNTGNENFGGIADYIDFKEKAQKPLNIIPRDDQKPVLEYKNGKFGIMAVPGAGKTTILLLLIIKMLKQGINPENIFVLTYMEAAAKNLKERLQLAVPDSINLPNISTIHGLALRIIKENANYIKAGLDDKFEICDDTTKERIVKELLFKLKADDEKYDNYLKCISIAKLSLNGNMQSKYKEINEFFDFYDKYNKTLKAQNLIDYDDMLYYAVKILKENPDILSYYQNICKYIIEDEAQDSTEIQQTLIALLNGKYNNFVRCGDINQAITSTFTNSNPESFKNFIKNSKKTEMVSSQRCAKPVYELANQLIKAASQNIELKNSFYPIEITGTENNPKSDKKPEYITFQEEKEEKQYILNKISEILKNNSKASVAILLRLNSQVTEYNEFFLNNGINTSVRTDCLFQKNIYKRLINILYIIRQPLNNGFIYNLAQNYKLNDNCLNYIKELKTPFIKENSDDMTEEGLIQLYWDIDYWLNNSATKADLLVLNIGLYYAKNNEDKSNAYMLSTMVKKLITAGDNLEEIIKKLEYMAQKPMSAYKFYEEAAVNEEISPVSIMTMHKAKGDEFDYVFIPELNEENYSTSPQNVKLKSGSHFVQTIKNAVENCGLKSQEELKKEQVSETLRLLYVGITRAKKELYFTNAKNYKKRKNTKNIGIFDSLDKIFIETK